MEMEVESKVLSSSRDVTTKFSVSIAKPRVKSEYPFTAILLFRYPSVNMGTSCTDHFTSGSRNHTGKRP
jgi:hypothetical protein